MAYSELSRRHVRSIERASMVAIAVVGACAGTTHAEVDTDLFGAAADDASEQLSEHPYGETALERMVVLAHTEALPACDKVIIATIKLPSRVTESKAKATTNPRTAKRTTDDKPGKVLAERSLNAKQSERVCQQWRRLTFDKWASAFCHFPVYRLRFYREEMLLFETTVCWQCSNFVLPTAVAPASEDSRSESGDPFSDSEQSASRTQLYGFQANADSERLLETLRHLLPHPGIADKTTSKETH